MSAPKTPVRQGGRHDFQTPPEALAPLFPYLPAKWTIWECAAGKGNLTKELEAKGYKVISTDINTGKDFLKYEPTQHYDCIITNPPYDIKDDFLERAYALGKPFAFLLPLTTFEGKTRQALFEKYGLEVIMFNTRINFEVPTAARDKKDSGSWFMTAWFTNKMKLDNQINFVSLDKGDKGDKGEPEKKAAGGEIESPNKSDYFLLLDL